ncbi:transmembrane amino acid transporter protein-domain-containing protein [Coniochaeta sp. 2T2.1]|nr:transmembrane amino acid transporter protein-domain-containing protein [Coniochaeta sp. 2T2.1]
MAASRNPSTWDEYEGRRGSSPGRNDISSSLGRGSVRFDETDSLLGHSPNENGEGEWPRLRRRRSSVTNRLAALTELGGVNSIRSFTKSWQRAAGFQEVIPNRPSFAFAPDQQPIAGVPGASGAFHYGRSDVESGHRGASLLRQHFENGPPDQVSPGTRVPEENPLVEEEEGTSQPGTVRRHGSESSNFRDREAKALESDLAQAFRVGSRSDSIFAIPPHLATPPIVGSYGTVRSDVTGNSMEHAATLWRQQQETGANVPDGEVEPIFVKEVEQDGKIILTVEGQSTLPQTVFNSINVLIGVGLLSLPMGFKYAGWLCGMTTLALCAAVTKYTAGLLAKCMDLDPSIITFSDLAFISFGRNARIATSVLFTLELLAACVALIVLFGDSLELLFPGFLTVTEWKVMCSLIMVPLQFLPLRLLSFTSIIGIFSCFSIVFILILDGFIKPTAPGSLIEPAKTYLFPANWLTLPLSFGLLMSPWGGHSVFPNIYRDMRHPYRYPQALKITFSFTYLLDMVTAVAGILMFGEDVRDAITSNILMTTDYPRALTFLMCLFIAIIPLTKLPLNARPIISTAEVLMGLHQQSMADTPGLVGRSSYFRGVMKIAIRVLTVFVFLVIAIVFPAFDSIMAFMGSALCFTICVTLPLAFYLRLFKNEITAKERVFATTVMFISLAMSIVGTVWAFLPKSLIGAEPKA